jgi:cation diffusion facilitator family transporter
MHALAREGAANLAHFEAAATNLAGAGRFRLAALKLRFTAARLQGARRMSGTSGSVRAILYALGANGGIFLAKAVAAAMTGSGAMLAEAVHSLADCGNQGLLLFGMKRARRPPTPDYPLGYGKEVYFWSFLVALMLFSVGGAFSVYEGVHKIFAPEPIERPLLGVGVLVFSLALEWWSLRACLQEINRTRGGASLWRWFRDSRDSEMIVVFGEQVAAIAGLGAAVLAVAITLATGNPIYDAVGTVAIGVLLIVVAVFVAIEVKALLIGQSVETGRRVAIRKFLEARPEVRKVHNVITLQLGPDVMVATKACFDPQLSSPELMRQINEVEAALRAAFGDVRWSFFEPDDED